MIENYVKDTIKGIDGEVVVTNTAEASSFFGKAAQPFFIIVYYGRIAPYGGVVIKFICICTSVGNQVVTQAKRPWNPVSPVTKSCVRVPSNARVHYLI